LPPIIDPGIQATESETKQQWSGTLALRMNIFDGLGIESRNAAAEAQLRRAQADLDNLERNLSAEVNQAVIQYAEAVERERVSARSFEAARENLNLTQQKYNVGSATILELVDSQVQATRAAANIVVARTGMKIAEAQVERVRGRGL
jgi:outer membrane protein TolC